MPIIYAIGLLAIILFSSCEKEQCYPIIKKDHVVYLHGSDTIKAYYENLDISFQYCGEDVDGWVRSQSYQVSTLYTCGGLVDGVFYQPLIISITYMTEYLNSNL